MGRLKLNAQISEEAAEWLVEFRSGDIDAEGRRAFDAWVRSSPEHLRAFIEIAAIWNEGSTLDAARELDIDALLKPVNAGANVIPLSPSAPIYSSSVATTGEDPPMPASGMRTRGPVALPPVSSRRRFRRYASAASLLLAIAGAGFLAWNSLYRAPTYSTAVGEKRTITLADGSTIALDSHTRLQVRFTDAQRLVDLQEGQALFHVAKNTERPFIVKSGDTQVRAVGTAFDVFRKNDGTVVTVVEGRVAVLTPMSIGSTTALESISNSSPVPSVLPFPASEAAGSGNIFLSAGEQLRVTQQTVKKSDHPNIASATAWTDDKVILDSAPLTQVAEEFNRYSTRKLIVEDSGSAPLRLSGVFTTDPKFLLAYLKERPDIKIVETDSEIHILRRETK